MNVTFPSAAQNRAERPAASPRQTDQPAGAFEAIFEDTGEAAASEQRPATRAQAAVAETEIAAEPPPIRDRVRSAPVEAAADGDSRVRSAPADGSGDRAPASGSSGAEPDQEAVDQPSRRGRETAERKAGWRDRPQEGKKDDESAADAGAMPAPAMAALPQVASTDGGAAKGAEARPANQTPPQPTNAKHQAKDRATTAAGPASQSARAATSTAMGSAARLPRNPSESSSAGTQIAGQVPADSQRPPSREENTANPMPAPKPAVQLVPNRSASLTPHAGIEGGPAPARDGAVAVGITRVERHLPPPTPSSIALMATDAGNVAGRHTSRPPAIAEGSAGQEASGQAKAVPDGMPGSLETPVYLQAVPAQADSRQRSRRTEAMDTAGTAAPASARREALPEPSTRVASVGKDEAAEASGSAASAPNPAETPAEQSSHRAPSGEPNRQDHSGQAASAAHATQNAGQPAAPPSAPATLTTPAPLAPPSPALATNVAAGIAGAVRTASAASVTDAGSSVRPEAVQSIALALDAREHGQIDVHITLKGNALAVRLKAERRETADALARDEATLREVLHRAGYDAQQIHIDKRDTAASRSGDGPANGGQQPTGSGTGASSGQSAGDQRAQTPDQRSQLRPSDGFALPDQETQDAPRQDRYRGADRLYV